MADLTPEARKHFLDDLRRARSAALADAEAFDEVIFAIERLGAFLLGQTEGLGAYRRPLSVVAARAASSWEVSGGVEALKFERVYEMVNRARNDALHQGAAARHLASKCVELAQMLEDGLMSSGQRVKDFMVEGPVTARPFETVASVRRSLLANSFTYLPIFADDAWKLVGDAALVKFLRSADSTPTRKKLLGMQMSKAIDSGLELGGSGGICQPDDLVEDWVAKLGPAPLLVVRVVPAGADDLLGVLTPFDLL